MAQRRFNWTVAIVIITALMVLAITAIGLRKWQRSRMAYSAKEIGLKAYEQHNWEDAAKNLGRYLAIEQTNVDILLKHADSHLNIRPLKQNNIQQAIATYRIILRIDKKNETAAQKLVSLYLQMGAESEAELIARRYLEVNENPKIRRMLAISLATQRRFKEAGKQLEDIIDKHPEQIQAYEILGRITEYYPEEFPERLKNWFTEAVKKNPTSAEAFIIQASFYIRNNNVTKAVENLKKAENLDLSDSTIHLRLATEFMKAKNYGKAKKHFELIYAKDPQNQNLWAQWAKLALETKEKDLMSKIAKTGLAELKLDSWAFMPLATEMFIRCGDFDNAQIYLDKLKQKEFSPTVIMFLDGLVAKAKNQDYEAIHLWRQAIQSGDKSEKTHLALAQALSHIGDNQSAIMQLRILVSERPYLFKGHFNLAQLLIQIGSWEEAKTHARFAMQISPNSLDAVLMYITTQIELIKRVPTSPANKKTLQAITRQLTELNKITGGNFKVNLLQFQLAMYQNDFEYAEKLLGKLKIDRGNKARIDIAKINLLIARDEIEEAISKLYTLIEESPENTTFVKYIAALLAGNKNKKECEKVLQDAIQRSEDNFAKKDLCILMSKFYEQWGQNKKASQILKKMSLQMPYDITIKRQLLSNKNVLKNNDYAQKLVDSIKIIEGENGWQWRNEQAKIWLHEKKLTEKYSQIIIILKKALSINPEDQASRMLLAITYEKFGKLQLAIATYKDALNRSPDDIRIIIPTIAALYKAKEYKMADEILNRVTRQKISHPELSKLELQSHLRHGELSSAENVLEDLASNDPSNQDVMLALALIKTKQKKYGQADKILQKLKSQQPDSIPITAALVDLNLNQKKQKQALSLCNQLVKKLNNSSAYILRGQTYMKLGQNNSARNDIEQAVMIEPDNVSVWISKSKFHRFSGEYNKAAECIEKALRLDPNNIHIQKRAVAFLLSSGESEKITEGLKLLDNALTSNPHDLELRMYRAKWLITKGNVVATTQAQRILQRISIEEPKNPELWILMAQIHLKQKQIGKTMDTILRGLTYFPDNENLLLLKAQAEAKRSPALAIPTLKMLMELHPNNFKVILELANTYILTEQYEKSVSILHDYLSICPKNKYNDINIALAAALYKKGDKIKANERFEMIYHSDPNNTNLLLTQITLLQQEGQWKHIFKKASEWYQNHPKDIKTQIAIAQTVMQSKNSLAQKTAEDIYRMVLKQNPDSTNVMIALAIYLQINERYEESCKLYEKAIHIKPDELIALNNLAWMMSEEEGKYEHALELTQRGLKKDPDYIDLIDTRGIAYYRLGKHLNAVKDFKKCIELYPENLPALTTTHFHLARALAALGQNKEADRNIQKALDLNNKIGGLSPTDLAEAKRMLSRL